MVDNADDGLEKLMKLAEGFIQEFESKVYMNEAAFWRFWSSVAALRYSDELDSIVTIEGVTCFGMKERIEELAAKLGHKTVMQMANERVRRITEGG